MPVSATVIEPLNPDVYLNHLSPSEAAQLEISRNVTLVILGANICDILTYVPDDVKIIKRSKFDCVIFCFIFSRLLALSYVFINLIERVLPTKHPHAIAIGSAYLFMLPFVTSSYLFLRRVQAVYTEHKWVRRIFLLLWAGFSVPDVLVPIKVNGALIPGTDYYRYPIIPPYVAIAPFTLLFFDTAVLFAISYKITSMHSTNQLDHGIPWYTTVFGGALPRLPRAILRGGQQYYLIMVGVTAITGIIACLPSIPEMLNPPFSVAMVPLIASMACRVYRNTKLFDLDATCSKTRMGNIPAVQTVI